MRWSTYIAPAGGGERAGLLRGDEIYGLREPESLLELLGDGGERLTAARSGALNDPFEVLPASSARMSAVPP